MTTRIGRLLLAHPVLNASGTLDAIAAHAALGDATLGCAAHVTKTITLEPRDGNPPPRIVEAPSGIVNSIGLPGPGLRGYLDTVLPATAAVVGSVPIITSIGGFTTEQYAAMAQALDAADAVAGIELNLSCPNVESRCAAIGADRGETERVTTRVRAVTRKPVFVKLSATISDIADVARAAEAAGADALVIANTTRALVLGRDLGGSYLGGGGGGLSGPALRPLALAACQAVRSAVSCDLIGVGGIETTQDARAFIAVGAQAVGVGTALFRDPWVAQLIAEELQTRPAAAAAAAFAAHSGPS